jgi:hypothetical protein
MAPAPYLTLIGSLTTAPYPVGGDPACQFPLVEEPNPTLTDRLQRVGELGEPHLFTLEIHPLSIVEVLAGLVGQLQHLLGNLEPEGRGSTQREPSAREPDRRDQDFLQAHPAVARQELLPSPQGAGDGRRCPADDRAHAGPVLEDHRLRATAGSEGRGRQPLAGHHVVIIYELGLAGRVPDEGEPAAPDRAHQRLGDADGCRSGDRSVRSVAPRAVRLGGSLGGVRRTRSGREGALRTYSIHNWLLCTVFTASCRPGPKNYPRDRGVATPDAQCFEAYQA